MNEKKSLVSVVIPTHNRKKMLGRLVSGLLKNDYKNIEIIIVDDTSTDDTSTFIKNKFGKYKNLILYSNKKNLYTAGSRNKGASLAKGKYIFFIDDDNVVTNNLISHLVAVMDEDVTVGEVGPLMYCYSNSKKMFWAGTKRNMTTSKTHFFNKDMPASLGSTWETDDIPNAFMVRRDLVKKNAISFVENFGIMYEESDYAWKIRKAGYKILAVKSAIIYHDVEDVGDAPAAFLYHTLKDKRRVYFTARNRLIFHSMYSSSAQLIGIVCFWQWFFAAFYCVNILRYKGKENYTLSQKCIFILAYFRGIYDGIKFTYTKKL